MQPFNALEISRIIVIGVSEWPYKYLNVVDAKAGLKTIAEEIRKETPHLTRIEIKVEFTNGDSERCAYSDEERCQTWLDRFRVIEP